MTIRRTPYLTTFFLHGLSFLKEFVEICDICSFCEGVNAARIWEVNDEGIEQ